MKIRVVPVGNSKGIRIPRPLLELCHIHSTVELNVLGNAIVIRPLKRKPRAGWEAAFKTMHARGDDQLLIDDNIDLNFSDWKW